MNRWPSLRRIIQIFFMIYLCACSHERFFFHQESVTLSYRRQVRSERQPSVSFCGKEVEAAVRKWSTDLTDVGLAEVKRGQNSLIMWVPLLGRGGELRIVYEHQPRGRTFVEVSVVSRRRISDDEFASLGRQYKLGDLQDLLMVAIGCAAG